MPFSPFFSLLPTDLNPVFRWKARAGALPYVAGACLAGVGGVAILGSALPRFYLLDEAAVVLAGPFYFLYAFAQCFFYRSWFRSAVALELAATPMPAAETAAGLYSGRLVLWMAALLLLATALPLLSTVVVPVNIAGAVVFVVGVVAIFELIARGLFFICLQRNPRPLMVQAAGMAGGGTLMVYGFSGVLVATAESWVQSALFGGGVAAIAVMVVVGSWGAFTQAAGRAYGARLRRELETEGGAPAADPERPVYFGGGGS